mmetsp:Transcript_27610/g.43102  ORF Transcript_27610/g.43102 Transcript_27610/m.43102 type:complete len:101 (-) Transcript_27610:1825-2127(-)
MARLRRCDVGENRQDVLVINKQQRKTAKESRVSHQQSGVFADSRNLHFLSRNLGDEAQAEDKPGQQTGFTTTVWPDQESHTVARFQKIGHASELYQQFLL